MATEMGEYVVGAYLKLEKRCDFVDYNVRPPGGGLEGLKELDVVGLRFKSRTAYLCEVTTHIRELLYGDNRKTVARVKQKYARQQEYACQHLKYFRNRHFMFWSPVVPRGYLTENLIEIEGLELIINEEYGMRVKKLRKRARTEKQDTGNPFFAHCRFLITYGARRALENSQYDPFILTALCT